MSRGWNADDPARVLVTGCSSGIGEALCAELHKRGHHVIATSRDRTPATEVPAAEHLQLDVTDPRSVEAAAAAGSVDVLVNNAGVTAWAPLEHLPVDTAQVVFDVNVWGVLRMCQAVLPSMRSKGRGRIINISSAAALRSYPLLGLYAASKSALESLSEALRLELSGFGVDVVVAEPAAVVTRFGANRLPVDAPDPSYDDLTQRAFRYLQGMRGVSLSPEEAAAALADMVELDDPPLRIPVGDDARRLASERYTVADPEFERGVLSGLWGPDRRTRRRPGNP
jgi:NAD(P)-dependent dehydrogenase (short-subunit alcohol dehydrogenase family)